MHCTVLVSGVKLNKQRHHSRLGGLDGPAPPTSWAAESQDKVSAKKLSAPSALQLPLPPQVQATVVGFLASIAAVVFGWIPDGHFSIPHAFLLCASSVATAFIASLVLGEEGREGEEAARGRE